MFAYWSVCLVLGGYIKALDTLSFARSGLWGVWASAVSLRSVTTCSLIVCKAICWECVYMVKY